MSARIDVVEGVEDDVESLEPCDIELRVFDVVVVSFDLDVGVELVRRFFGNLLQRQRMLSHLTQSSGAPLRVPWTS